METSIDENVLATSKVKGKKDNRKYLKNPLVEFEEWAYGRSKPPPPSLTEQSATERTSIKSLEGREAAEVLDKVWMPPMELIVCV